MDFSGVLEKSELIELAKKSDLQDASAQPAAAAAGGDNKTSGQSDNKYSGYSAGAGRGWASMWEPEPLAPPVRFLNLHSVNELTFTSRTTRK